MVAILIDLATRQQRDLIWQLLGDLGYQKDNAFFLSRLKTLTGRSRVRTFGEAEAAIGILGGILAARSANAVARDPQPGGRGRAV